MKLLRLPVPGQFPAGAFFCTCHWQKPTGSLVSSLPVNQKGLSLLEVLVSLSIASILGVMATGAGSMLRSYTAATELNGLMADMAYARIVAIKYRQTITICASNDGSNCNRGSAWDRGWIIFTDADRDRLRDPGDRLLRVQGPLSKGTRLNQGSGYYYYIMYRPTGMAYPNATFTFCHEPRYRRAIIIFRSGRARVSTVSSSGNALNCDVS
ncbi:MAG: GspH/FimT family protein [Acidiferrobacterales bacterium]